MSDRPWAVHQGDEMVTAVRNLLKARATVEAWLADAPKEAADD